MILNSRIRGKLKPPERNFERKGFENYSLSLKFSTGKAITLICFFMRFYNAFSLHFFQAIGYNGAKKVVDVNFVAA